MIKNLTNIICGLLVLLVLWRIFFYWIMPRFVNQYGKARRAERKYQREIESINKETYEENNVAPNASDTIAEPDARADSDASNKPE